MWYRSLSSTKRSLIVSCCSSSEKLVTLLTEAVTYRLKIFPIWYNDNISLLQNCNNCHRHIPASWSRIMLDNGKSSGQGPWCWGCCKHYESNICQKLPPGYQSHSANHEISKQSKLNQDIVRNAAGSKGRCQEHAKVPLSSLYVISKSIKRSTI